ncbi:MAG TPA: VanW family protein [bacterium]|nr:VanW family protein [bacterium]
MEKINPFKKFNYQKWLVIPLAIFLFVILIITGLYFWFNTRYEEKFYPGIKLAGVNLSGLTQAQAKKIFKAKTDEFGRIGQKFFYQNKHTTIFPVSLSTADPDLSVELINFPVDDSFDKIFQIGRGKNLSTDIWQKIKFLFAVKNYQLNYILNQEAIIKNLKINFGQYEKEGSNPELTYIDNNFIISPEKIGLTFNYTDALKKLQNNLNNLEFNPIELNLTLQQPDFSQKEAESLINSLNNVIAQAPIEIFFSQEINHLVSEEKKIFAQKDLGEILTLNWDNESKKPKITFKQNELEKKLVTQISKIEKPVIEAKFNIADGKVVEFKASEAGQQIDWPATIKNLEEKIINKKENRAEIIVQRTEPQVTTDTLNNFGIKELIGFGESSYVGSPVNRRKNIKVGADSLNGLLIKPGETFSLNQALGDITPTKGYVPELVIKGTKTVPEYGGGLCQIATTAFRLALNSGLKIIERKPHAYRVSYYEPAGTDATIYSPNPDLKFLNDTPNYLLLQTFNYSEENKLRFEFWGTSDGRTTTSTKPRVFNIVPAGETKYIETTELAPEKVKCTETAHAGADAEFTRTITYADGRVEEETFKSHYRPWQAVCLIGIDPNKINTTTPEITAP